MQRDEVTTLLQAWADGAQDAPARLMEAVYTELQQLASAKMRKERSDHTLQPTELVHEAYMRLVGNQDSFEDRAHFFGAAARAMERVLVDHARKRRATKRGPEALRVTFQDVQVQSEAPDADVLAMHDVLGRLEAESAELAMLVRFRYFVGLTLDQVADLTGDSLSTLKRRWTFAKAWLHDQLK